MKQPFDVRHVDLDKLNTMTKYPSILTYHEMGERGMLLDRVQIPFNERMVYATEKVDGTSARIICCPDASIIVGSREMLLWEREDLLYNTAMNIVSSLKEMVLRSHSKICPTTDTIFVYYGEVYGKIGSAADVQYTADKATAFRLFDVIAIPNYRALLELPIEKIASWREHNDQFVPAQRIHEIARELGWLSVPPVWEGEGRTLPTTVNDTMTWMASIAPSTRCLLDDNAIGEAEGIVLRTESRDLIAKLRFEDYTRTILRLS